MIAYINGEYCSSDDASVSIHDRGLMFGDAVFDIARTFNGEPFKLREHLERLRKSLNYVELPGNELVGGLEVASIELVRRNADEIALVGDVFVEQIVTRGLAEGGYVEGADPGPTIIAKLRPINFGRFAPYYDQGVDLKVSLLTLPFSGAVDPRVKGANRLANSRADLKGERAKTDGYGHWTLLFNSDGTIPETSSANLAIVEDEDFVVPPLSGGLEGISLRTACQLAEEIGLSVNERRLTAYDLLNADEVVITATSFSILPVVAVDGIRLQASGQRVYSELLDAWRDLVNFDFVGQAKERAGLVPAADQEYRAVPR